VFIEAREAPAVSVYDQPTDPAKRRSSALTDGVDRAPARAMLKAVGFTDDDLAKPLIGVATTWIETMPCNLNQRKLAQDVKRARFSALTKEEIEEAFANLVELSEPLARASAENTDLSVRADAFALPLADGAVDVVTCSQVLHHFAEPEATRLLRELSRVARRLVVVSDLRRSWLAAAGIWIASFPLGFHPVSRHDGVVSVLRGFTPRELAELVRGATGVGPRVRRHIGFRVTASWSPSRRRDGDLA
jgi:SAM-dependent methyltransferase